MSKPMKRGGRPSRVLKAYEAALRSREDPASAGKPWVDIDVPCGSCVACCRAGYEVVLRDYESGEGLDLVERGGERFLRRKDDGSCTHLTGAGCAVHACRPSACRVYDCRVFAIAGLQASLERPREELNRVILSWQFDIDSTEEFATAAAYRVEVREAVQAGAGVETAAMVGLVGYRKQIGRVREWIKAMPPEERRKSFLSCCNPGLNYE